MRSPERNRSSEFLRTAIIFATIATLQVFDSWNTPAEAQTTPAKGKIKTNEVAFPNKDWQYYHKIVESNGVRITEIDAFQLEEFARELQRDGYDADSLIADYVRTSRQFHLDFGRVLNGAGKNARHYYDAYQKIFSETKRRMIAQDSTLAIRFERGEKIQLDRKIFDAVKTEVKGEYQRLGADPFVTDTQIGVFLEPTTEPPVEPALKLPSAYKFKVNPQKMGKKTNARVRTGS